MFYMKIYQESLIAYGIEELEIIISFVIRMYMEDGYLKFTLY